MSLTGVHVYKQDKNTVEKQFYPWSEENIPPPEFLKKIRETQNERTKDFFSTLLNQDLESNFRPKKCACHLFFEINQKSGHF